MATENWAECLKTILHHEGGYVNQGSPGGETNAYEKSIRRTRRYKRHERFNSGRCASFTKSLYWDRIKGDQLLV